MAAAGRPSPAPALSQPLLPPSLLAKGHSWPKQNHTQKLLSTFPPTFTSLIGSIPAPQCTVEEEWHPPPWPPWGTAPLFPLHTISLNFTIICLDSETNVTLLTFPSQFSIWELQCNNPSPTFSHLTCLRPSRPWSFKIRLILFYPQIKLESNQSCHLFQLPPPPLLTCIVSQTQFSAIPIFGLF